MKINRRVAFLSLLTFIASLGLPLGAQAGLISAYLVSSQSSPTNVSSPPFSVNGTTVYQLNLTGTVATSFSLIAGDLNFDIDSALTYNSSSGDINPSEIYSGTEEERVNAEVSTWDDVGIFNNSGDAALNADYGSQITFNGVGDGFMDLIIAEDAGLDPLGLSLCSTVTTCADIFSGFSDEAETALLGLPNFSGGDTSNSSNMDQLFVFRFDEAVFDLVKVSNTGNFGGATLEVDFIGVGTATVVPDPDPGNDIPAPATLALFGLGLAGLGWSRRKKA